jgi:hypothetical protein
MYRSAMIKPPTAQIDVRKLACGSLALLLAVLQAYVLRGLPHSRSWIENIALEEMANVEVSSPEGYEFLDDCMSQN